MFSRSTLRPYLFVFPRSTLRPYFELGAQIASFFLIGFLRILDGHLAEAQVGEHTGEGQSRSEVDSGLSDE